MMDDEEEIRERNTKLVMSLLDANKQEVIPLYAQELFIQFLMNSLTQLSVYESIALVMLIVISGNEGDNGLNKNVEEYRVFDKNEVNLFSETFVIKKMCLSAVKAKLLQYSESDEGKIGEIKKISAAAETFSECGNKAVIESCLKNL
jgi:hypothetical protein